MNPYSKIAMRSRSGMHVTEAKRPGSNEFLVGAGGNLNAGSKQELMQTIASLTSMLSNGEISPRRSEVSASESKDRREALVQAYHDRSGRSWAELGAAIGGEVSESADREGFMRRFLLRTELSQGEIARIRVKHKNVTAIVAASASQTFPTFIREKHILPPEFYIEANIRVEAREVAQGSADVLEEKFFEAQEAIMVQEDRVYKRMLDDTVGVGVNAPQVLSGGLTPVTLQAMREQVTRWGIPAQNLLIASDVWNDIVASTAFGNWFDPVSQYEIIMTGYLGNLLGMGVISDAYREPKLKVLNAGEVYITSSPELHGTFTDRGPVEAHETGPASGTGNTPSRGWYMFEMMSMTLHNARAVCKGTRA